MNAGECAGLGAKGGARAPGAACQAGELACA